MTDSDTGQQDGVGEPDAFERLWTPHRIVYIKGEGKPATGDEVDCPFCRIPQMDDVEGLIVHRGSAVARTLLDEAERQVAAQGYDEAWLAVVAGNARARRFYERRGWRDGGDLPYEVSAGGATYLSPCRRYLKPVR